MDVRRRTVAVAAVVGAVALVVSGCVLNGSWTAVAPFDPRPSTATSLIDLSCIDATFCLAVGSEGVAPGVPSTADIQRWDGATWSPVSLPPTPPGSTSISLLDVSCGTPTSCAVVTTTPPGPSYQAGFARWDGTAWSSVPLGGGSSGASNQVACVGADGCVFTAVGVGTVTWDGTSYSSPVTGTPSLHDLSCSALDDCVGVRLNPATAYAFDGTAWTPTPPMAAAGNLAWGIDCVAADFCLAVGSTVALEGRHPVAERWDGSSWTDTPIPAATGILRDVSCTSTVSCVAVGVRDQDAIQTTAFGWNGGAWYEIAAPPAPDTATNVYTVISCTVDDQCFAGGYHNLVPLFARYAWPP